MKSDKPYERVIAQADVNGMLARLDNLLRVMEQTLTSSRMLLEALKDAEAKSK